LNGSSRRQSFHLHNAAPFETEIREYAMTIATHVARAFNQNPTIRPKY
jgi:hypothetical protein